LARRQKSRDEELSFHPGSAAARYIVYEEEMLEEEIQMALAGE
jgi:hypothetical protein